MQYISSRGNAPVLDFEQVVLKGLASDGGLYLPNEVPQFDRQTIASWAGLDYQSLALQVMLPFVKGSLEESQLKKIIDASYQHFNHRSIAPLVQLDSNLWVLELFHGPTLAFKDFALQFLGNLFDYFLAKRQQKSVILGATSGDTGSAAIHGCHHSEWVDMVILHPHQKISDIQRLQMSTVTSSNVHNLALQGDFDACQAIVKQCFTENFTPQGRQLIAVNSINWARIMAQIVYYFYAALRLGAPVKVVSFSVPSGNFGDIYAGYLAKQMGLPIQQLVIGTNSNNILHRCLSENDYRVAELQSTLSPSMDIMVSSNFERLLFNLYQGDGATVNALMQTLKEGKISLSAEALAQFRSTFSSCSLNDEQVLAEIAARYQSEYLLDPHSAIATASGSQAQDNTAIPMVCLATAHPAKFADAIQRAGVDNFQLPPALAHLQQLPERYQVLPNDAGAVKRYIENALA